MADPITCPFCGFRSANEYTVQLHIEEQHTEDSPFTVHDGRERSRRTGGDPRPSTSESSDRSMPGDTWTRCTRQGCGEYVLLSEIDEHLDIHKATALSEQENAKEPDLSPRIELRAPPGRLKKPPPPAEMTTRNVRKLEKRSPRKSEGPRSGSSILSIFSGSSNHSRSTIRPIGEKRNRGRLGKNDLGPWAFEERMPENVRHHLMYGARPKTVQRIGKDGRLVRETFVPNETLGLVDHVLADLCALDEDNAVTYLCHPSVKHIRKLHCEGNFCGFWSAQMVLSYIQHMHPEGPQELPNVLQMQDLMEKAWDRGVCAHSRVETGGIKNTRKWIGTTEVFAFFTYIGVKVEALSIGDEKANQNHQGLAALELLDYVEAYFMSGADAARQHGNVHITNLAPLFFQKPGHSMVIVGLEREHDGNRNLLVLDSSFATSQAVQQLLNGRKTRASLDSLLRPYRRTAESLARWHEYELLVVQASLFPQPASNSP